MKTAASFCLIGCLLICCCTGQENISADVGMNATVQCKAADSAKPFTAVECIKPGLVPELLLVYRDGRINQQDQDPSFQNRVDLQDKETKDKRFSLTLMNVTMEDIGRYECRGFQGTKNELICSFHLEVRPPGNKVRNVRDGGDKDGGDKDGGGMVGLIVGPIGGVIGGLAVFALIGFLLYKRHERQNPNGQVPTNDPASIPMSARSDPAEPTPPPAPLMDPPAEEETKM